MRYVQGAVVKLYVCSLAQEKVSYNGRHQGRMSTDSNALVEWIVSVDKTRSLLAINFCETGREELWQNAKRACHELLNLPQGIKHYTVSVNDISEDIKRCWPDVIRDLQKGLCTLFEMELEKIGRVVGIGKGYNNAVKEKAGAVAMLTSAWLVDKAKKTKWFRTVHKHS